MNAIRMFFFPCLLGCMPVQPEDSTDAEDSRSAHVFTCIYIIYAHVCSTDGTALVNLSYPIQRVFTGIQTLATLKAFNF